MLENINQKNLIILNGQLKYYQFTLPYWKKFSELNDCHILIISQAYITYKNQHKEMISEEHLQKYLTNYTFIEITSKMDKCIDLEINIIEQSIVEHNKKFNMSHDIENYSGRDYLKRSFYRQLSTLYVFHNILKKNELKRFERILYARVDFLIFTSNNQFMFKNGQLYDYSFQDNQIICKESQHVYTISDCLSIPDIKNIHNFSISDFTYWCSYDILYKYLTAYINNYYKYSWTNNKVCPTVEAQANQSRRHLNDTLPSKQQLWDIYDFKNNLFSFNFYFNEKIKRVQIRLHRVKTQEQFNKLLNHPLSLEKLNQKSTSLSRYSFIDKIVPQEISFDLSELTQDFHTLFGKLDTPHKVISFKEIIKNKNLIIKLNMASFMLEHKSLNYKNVNVGKFEQQTKMILLLLELLKINPHLNIIIHTIDLHRMNWEIFLYFIKLLQIKYIFFMYCPWFVRKIMRDYQNLDYQHKVDQYQKDLIQYYKPVTFRMVFYPRYLWKTRGILQNLCQQLNINPEQIFEQPKEYDILFYGCINPKVNPDPISKQVLSSESYINLDEYYQFRKRLYHLLKKNKAFRKYNIKIIEWVSKHDPSGTYDTDLFELISKSKFTIATNANVQYMVRKYYEIPMSGSILMGNVPDYAPDIVKPNMIHLLMSMSNQQLIDIICQSIDNYSEHQSKQQLGKIMQQVANIYYSDNDFIEDTINYHQTKIKSTKLNHFINLLGVKDLESLPTKYQQDY